MPTAAPSIRSAHVAHRQADDCGGSYLAGPVERKESLQRRRGVANHPHGVVGMLRRRDINRGR